MVLETSACREEAWIDAAVPVIPDWHTSILNLLVQKALSYTTPTPAAQLQRRKHEGRYAVQVTTPNFSS